VDRNQVTSSNEIKWFADAKKQADKEREYFESPEMRKRQVYGAWDRQEYDEELRKQHEDLANKIDAAAEEKICPELFSLFGHQSTSTMFSVTPTAYQVLVAIVIIAKLSFWINKPILESFMEALDQFKTRQDYMERIQTHITSESMPDNNEALVSFLYKLVIDFI